jgi:hypothetical protein
MDARSPRDGLARLTSAMILTRSAGARAARASSAGPSERGALHLGERPERGAGLGILHRTRGEVCQHDQCCFGEYFGRAP